MTRPGFEKLRKVSRRYGHCAVRGCDERTVGGLQLRLYEYTPTENAARTKYKTVTSVAASFCEEHAADLYTRLAAEINPE